MSNSLCIHKTSSKSFSTKHPKIHLARTPCPTPKGPKKGPKKGSKKGPKKGPNWGSRCPEKPEKRANFGGEKGGFSRGFMVAVKSVCPPKVQNRLPTVGGGEGGQTTLKQVGGISENRSVLRGGPFLGVLFGGPFLGS